MIKNFIHKRSFLAQIAFLASYGAQFRFNIGCLIESVSSLQIMSLILKTSLSSFRANEIFVIDKVRDAASYLGLLVSSSTFGKGFYSLLVWAVFCGYLLAYLIFMLLITVLCVKGLKVNNKLSKICTLVNIIHSKVVFAPICFFYFDFINIQKKCEFNIKYSFSCGNLPTILTVVLLVINYAFAYLKEIYFYQTYKSKNFFSVTNNLHAIIQLTHKAVLLPLLILSDHTNLLKSILNVGFTLFYLLILCWKLPFYKTKYLKIATVQSMINFMFSLVLFWKCVFELQPKTFELLVILLTPLAVKLLLQRLNYLFERILNLKATSGYYLVHLPSLIRSHTQRSYAHNLRKLDVRTFYTYGLAKSFSLGASEQDSNCPNFFKSQKNLLILAEFLKSHRGNPKSVDILLYIAQFYVEKMMNITEAIAYLQKIEDLILSIPASSHLNQIKLNLESTLMKTYDGDVEVLELVNYFNYRDILANFTKHIGNEINSHIQFWQILSGNAIDINEGIKVCQKREEFASTIKSIWQKYEGYFVKNFPLSLMIYVTYLSVVQGSPYISQHVLEKWVGKNSKIINFMEEWFSQEKALIITSNQKGQLGKVLDASNSFEKVFNMKKEDIIGKKINILMPNMIREKHDELIQRYRDKHLNGLGQKFQIYCKTNKGLFFNADLKVKVYPYFDKGSALIGILEKKGESKSMLFVDVDGTIVDYSQEILDTFLLNFPLGKSVKIQDIDNKFEKVNEAFNSVYLPHDMYTSLFKKGNFRENEAAENSSNFLSKLPKTHKKPAEELQTMYLNSEEVPIAQEAKNSLTDRFRQNIMSGNSQQGTLMTSTSQDYQKHSKGPKIISNSVKFRNLLADEEEPDISSECVTLKRTEIDIVSETKRYEHKKICQEFLAGTILLLRPKSPIATSSLEWIRYFVKVDHFIFDHRLYKAITIQPAKRNNKVLNEISISKPVRDQIPIQSSPIDNFQLGPEKKNEESHSQRLLKNKISVQNVSLEYINENFDEEVNFSNKEDNNKLIETLDKLFNKECNSAVTKVFFGLFYFTMLLVLLTATISFCMTNHSFDQIKLAVKLVSTDSRRLTSLIKLWGSANIIYHNSVMNHKITDVRFYPLIDLQLTIAKQTNKDLVEYLGSVDSSDILNEFYKKDIQLWDSDPNDKTNFLLHDLFIATNIIVDKMRTFADQSQYSPSLDQNLVVFVVNNTVNDVVIAAEKELYITDNTKNDIYSKNNYILKGLLTYQGFSVIIASLSLLAFAIRIVKSHQRIFRIIATIPPQYIEARKEQLLFFQQMLNGEESMHIFQELNSFLEETIHIKRIKVIGFREEKKLYLKRLATKEAGLFVMSLLLFLFIFGLFYCLKCLSLYHIDSLRHFDQNIMVTTRLVRQAYLLNGNLMCWMSFYNQRDLKLRNQRLEDQLTENLNVISNLNQDLISTFSNEDSDFYDPNISKLLSGNICEFLEQQSLGRPLCEVATKGDVLGLLGIITQLHDQAKIFAENFKSDLAVGPNKNLITGYSSESMPLIATTEVASNFMTDYLLENLSQIAEEQRSSSTLLFCLLCVALVFVTFFVRILVLENFAKFYRKRYKIFTIIPKDVMLENKAVIFFIKKEFAKEKGKIKLIL